jgi:transposase
MCLESMIIQMNRCTHSYKQNTSKQFLDFIKLVDQKYDHRIKQIFLVLDNVSIHKSNKVKENLARYHPRILLVFLPTRSPELNLIEVRWGYGSTDRL